MANFFFQFCLSGEFLPNLVTPNCPKWSLLCFLFQVLGETLPYDTLQQVRGRLSEVAPNLTRYGLVEEANFFAQAAEVAALKAKTEKLSKNPIDVAQKVLEDFYMTDPITRYKNITS